MSEEEEYVCGNCGHQFDDFDDYNGRCDEHSCHYCECDCSDCAEEGCEYCGYCFDECECVMCWNCDANITELIDESSDPQGEIDWEHPCLNCEKKCDRLWSKGVPTWSQQKLRELPVEWSNPYEKPHDWEFLFTNGWKQDKEGKDDDVEGCRFKITMIRAS